MQAGGRRFDPVWLHQTSGRRDLTANVQSSNVQSSFVRILIRVPSAFVGAGVMSDIVKRRSIRALRAAVKPRAARYLQAFPRFKSFAI